MSLTCDLTGSTDRVEYLPSYMQTETVKKVCFRVAVKMEQERLAGMTAPGENSPKEPEPVATPVEVVAEPVSEISPAPKKKGKGKK